MAKKAIQKENLQEIIAYKNNQIIYLGNVQIKNWDELSSNQLKIAMFSACKVKLEDTHETKYTMSFKEYADLCKFEEKGGSIYERIYREARKMAKLGVDFIDKNGDTVIFNWLTSVRISPKSGIVTYKLDENLLPFYKTQKGTFAIINLLDYMPLRGKYALLLFEFLSMWQNTKERKVYQTIEQLRTQLQVPEETYTRPYDFIKQIIDRSVKQINSKTKYTFSVRYKTHLGSHNTVKAITFYIDPLENQTTTPIPLQNHELYETLKSVINKPKAALDICNNPEYSSERIIANIKLAQKRYDDGKANNLTATVLAAIKEDWAEIQIISPETESKLQKTKAAKEKSQKQQQTQLALLEIEAQTKQTAAAEVIDPGILELKEKWETKMGKR